MLSLVPLFARIADVLVLIHGGFIVFVVVGGFIAWRWRWVILLHGPAAIWGALIEFIGWVCPLTPAENYFRRLANEAPYEGGFIQHYLLRLIYPTDYTLTLRVTLGLLVVALNVLAYAVFVRRYRQSLQAKAALPQL